MFFSSYLVACFSNIFAMSLMQCLPHYSGILGQTNIKQDGLFYPFFKEVQQGIQNYSLTQIFPVKIDKGSKYFPWKKPTPYYSVSWAQILSFQAKVMPFNQYWKIQEQTLFELMSNFETLALIFWAWNASILSNSASRFLSRKRVIFSLF